MLGTHRKNLAFTNSDRCDDDDDNNNNNCETELTFFLSPCGMLLCSGYNPLLSFSFTTKLKNRPRLSLLVSATFSQLSGNEMTNFQYTGELGSTVSATGLDFIESASSEGMSSGLQVCSLTMKPTKKISFLATLNTCNTQQTRK